MELYSFTFNGKRVEITNVTATGIVVPQDDLFTGQSWKETVLENIKKTGVFDRDEYEKILKLYRHQLHEHMDLIGLEFTWWHISLHKHNRQ